MIDGIILGFITWLSMLFTFQHLPKVFRELLLNNPLVADIIATGLCFFFLASISQSILSVVGSITCGLLVNFTLIAYNTYTKTYEEE